MADNTLRFAVTLDDTGAIKSFRNLKTAAASAGSSVGTSFGTTAAVGLTKMEKGIAGVSGALGHAKSQISGVVGQLGLLAGVGGAAGIVGVLSQSVTAARNFGEAMDLIQTQAGGSAAEVKTMSAALIDMSRSVGTGPVELAAGLYHIESAGIRGAQALDVLKVSAEGARVGNANLESVTNALVASVTSGVRGVESMTGAMGTLNAIVGSGNMRMDDLTAALGTGVLSTAKIFGVSMQSVGAAIADMTNQGIPAVDAANAVRSAMRLMAAPTKAAAAELEGIGLSSTDLATDLRGPGGILAAVTDLKTHMDKAGLSATEQAALLVKAFGGKQSQGILTLVGDVGKLKAATDSVAAGAGSFDAAWTKTQEDAGFKWEKFSATLQKTAIKIGDVLLPRITAAMDDIGGWVDQHGDEISAAFKNAADAAEQIGSAVSQTVIPAFKNIVGVFQGLPEPVKQLLIGGFVGSKALKWTFGIDAGDLVKGAAGIGKQLLSNLFPALGIKAAVVNVSGAVVNGGGGGLPGVAGAAGGAAGLGAVATGAIVVGGVAAVGGLYAAGAWNQSQPGGGINVNALAGQAQGGVLPTAPGSEAARAAAARTAAEQAAAVPNLQTGPSAGPSAGVPKAFETAAGMYSRLFTGALDRVMKKTATDNQKFVVAQLKTAEAITKGSGSADKKADQLRAVQTDLLKHGDTWAAKQVQYLIDIANKPLSVSVSVDAAGAVHAGPAAWSGSKTRKMYATGAWRTGHEIAELHPDEMVLPAPAASAVRRAFSGIGAVASAAPALSGGSGAPASVDFHLHVHGANTPGAMREAAQSFGPSLVSWMQRNGVLPRTGSPVAG